MAIFTKENVAIDLLLHAVRMRQEGSLMAAILLSGASQQILRDICVSKNIVPAIETLANNSDPGVKKLHDFIVDTYNKLKHADKEQDNVDVNDTDAKVLIGLAATDLMRLNLPQNDAIKTILRSVDLST